jgi:hypothetical protein
VAVIARAHGGSAHATNREDGGADVSIYVPDEELAKRAREWSAQQT